MGKGITLNDLDTSRGVEYSPSPRLVANVLDEWKNVTKDDLAAGVEWYEEALTLANNLSAGSSYTVEQIVAVMSAMSSRMPWGRNKTATRIIVERHSRNDTDVTGIGLWDNVRLSYDLLDGDSPEDRLKNKRLNFWKNILGQKDIATIDSWMLKVIFGRDTVKEAAGDHHDKCSQVIEVASEMVGLNPRDFQAALWVMIRREMLTDKELANFENES